MESYKTVKKAATAEFIEKRSRFIGAAIPIKCEQDALDFITERRAKFWDATHNVYAYCLKDGTCRYSDDAEPQGTAGMPTLDVLVKSGVTDTCIVTTRYFGGILLGGGGLVRAYSHAASIALEAAGVVTMGEVAACTLKADYSLYGKLESVLSEYNVTDKTCEFTDEVSVNFSVRLDRLDSLKAEITDLSAGKVSVAVGATGFAQIKE